MNGNTTPGNSTRSNGNGHVEISVGSSSDDEAFAEGLDRLVQQSKTLDESL